MPKPYHTNIPAAYIVLLDGEKVLLSQRANTGFFDGSYSLPAGHLEPAENFTQALIREVKEEIGVSLVGEDVDVVHIMHRKADTDGSERVDTFFTARKWSGEIRNMEPEKCSELSWFPLGGLPDNTIPYVKTALENIQKKILYSEFGW